MINIYGKGGHAKVLKSSLQYKKLNFWNDEDFREGIEGDWVIAIGNNQSRKKIANKLGEDCYITLIEKSATVNTDVIGEGSQILHNSTIQIDSKIGKHCIINTAASIDHDCVLSDFSFIGPNATLCGGVEIGECSFIGAGSVILPYIKIGKNCMIGAGSVVTKDIPDNSTAYGNPARIK